MNRKPNSNSKLKTLSPERQADVAEYARTHSLAETVGWLRADGVHSSSSSLSEFLSWWALQQTFARAESNTHQFKEWLAKVSPELSEEQLDARAALLFQFEAVKTGDPDTYLAFATARHKAKMDGLKFQQGERKLAQDDRRIALLEKKAAQADQAENVTKSDLTPEEKQLKLKQIFGMT